jgi:Uma2 family endonuclease
VGEGFSFSATIEASYSGAFLMAERIDDTVKLSRNTVLGRIAAVDISRETYMRDYAESFHEWLEGVVYKMSPVSRTHSKLTAYFSRLFEVYFEHRPIAELELAPFVMKMEKSSREPDLQIILNESQAKFEETYTDGAADICIEVVSPSNEATDYGVKLREYEEGGVKEYWIIDPMRQECLFYRLNDAGVYKTIQTKDGIYSSPLLPDFQLDTSVLWTKNLPKYTQVSKMVKKMLEKAE